MILDNENLSSDIIWYFYKQIIQYKQMHAAGIYRREKIVLSLNSSQTMLKIVFTKDNLSSNII